MSKFSSEGKLDGPSAPVKNAEEREEQRAGKQAVFFFFAKCKAVV